MTTDAQAIDLPFKEAIDFFRQKGNVPTRVWTDVWKEAHSRSFMVAGAATDALVADFRAAVDKAISQGTTLAAFRQDFDQIVEKHGWVYNGGPGWRSRVIYETNLTGAYSAGRYAQMSDPDVQEMYPFWQYVHSGSLHPRLQHLAWDGLVLRCTDPFWDTHYPPNGWKCGCRARPVSARGLAALGKEGPDQAPPIQLRDWRNPNTGEVHKVPVGIDPGFDYNPGKAWKDAPVKTPRLKEEPGAFSPLHPSVRDPLPALPAPLKQFLDAPIGAIEVGELPGAVRHVLQTDVAEVKLSAETLRKQHAAHPDLAREDYAVLEELLAHPTVVLQQDAQRVLLLRRSGRVYAGVVKATAARDENWLVSLFRVGAKSLRNLLKRHDLVLGDADDLD